MGDYPSVHALLKKYSIQPKKSLGQNFLADESLLSSLVNLAGIQPADTVLEIGPGLGHLTWELSLVAGRVVAVELDQRMVHVLKETMDGQPHIEIIHGDILKIPLDQLNLPAGYKVVANIPYYITSAIIRRLLEQEVKPIEMWLTVQQEVAERICAKPGKMSLLSLGVQVYGQPQLVKALPANAFYPPPNVDSAFLKIALYSEPLIPMQKIPVFFTLAKAGFSQKRKTLLNSLAAGLRLPKEKMTGILTDAAIDGQRRAETLTVEEWNRLTLSADWPTLVQL